MLRHLDAATIDKLRLFLGDGWPILFFHSPIPTAIVASDHKITIANDAFCALTEYTKHELVNIKFDEITHPNDLDPDIRLLDDLISGKDIKHNLTKRYITRTGKTIWVHLTVYILKYLNEPFFIAFAAPIGNDVTNEIRKLIYHRSKEYSSTLKSRLLAWVVDNWKTVSGLTTIIIGLLFSGFNLYQKIDNLQKTQQQLEDVQQELLDTLEDYKNAKI